MMIWPEDDQCKLQVLLRSKLRHSASLVKTISLRHRLHFYCKLKPSSCLPTRFMAGNRLKFIIVIVIRFAHDMYGGCDYDNPGSEHTPGSLSPLIKLRHCSLIKAPDKIRSNHCCPCHHHHLQHSPHHHHRHHHLQHCPHHHLCSIQFG